MTYTQEKSHTCIIFAQNSCLLKCMHPTISTAKNRYKRTFEHLSISIPITAAPGKAIISSFELVFDRETSNPQNKHTL